MLLTAQRLQHGFCRAASENIGTQVPNIGRIIGNRKKASLAAPVLAVHKQPVQGGR